MRMIFVNLPVKDVQASRAFFGALGFTFNEQFSDENTAAMVIEENIVAMLLEHARFRDFIKGDISDHGQGRRGADLPLGRQPRRGRGDHRQGLAGRRAAKAYDGCRPQDGYGFDVLDGTAS